MRWLAPLIAAAAPALAEEGFDPAPAEACFSAADPAACIGDAAQACMQTDLGSSNVGIGMCLTGELEFWDAELNRLYTALREEVRLQDAELDDLGSAAPRSGPALLEAQRAWIDWRDAACTYERTRWGGGTGAGPAQTQCMLELTARQALRLDRDLAERGG